MYQYRLGRAWSRLVRHTRHVFFVVLLLPLLFGLILLTLALIEKEK
jgi:hypothetical protein